MKAEPGQEIPCTQVFLISPVHLGQGHNQGPGISVNLEPLSSLAALAALYLGTAGQDS